MLECIAIITKNQGSLSTVVGDEKTVQGAIIETKKVRY